MKATKYDNSPFVHKNNNKKKHNKKDTMGILKCSSVKELNVYSPKQYAL
jgi:hypothetical protein